MSQGRCIIWLGDFGHHTLHPYWDTGFVDLNTGHRPLNLCAAGETLNSLSDRLKRGLLTHLEPESIILNVGMNDIVSESPTDVASGICALAQQLAALFPDAQIGIHLA